MKLSAPFVFVLAAAGIAEAAHEGVSRVNINRHNVLGQRALEKRATKIARCKAKPSPLAATANVAKPPPKDDKPKDDKPKPPPQQQPPPPAPQAGVLNLDTACGPLRGTKDITTLSGPNGHIDVLNCGIEGGGWNPPYVRAEQLIVADLANVLKQPGNLFANCGRFVDMFYRYGGQFNVPPIIIASIAMQESSCNPNTVGQGGEQGLMQITRDKCEGRGDAGCQDPDFNIRTGVAYLSRRINDFGGNIVEALASYNGWHRGMTFGSATAAKNSACCRCMNDLDYIHMVLNGFAQGVDARQRHMGKFFNLSWC